MTTTTFGTDVTNPIDITVDASGGAYMPTIGKELHATEPDGSDIYQVIEEWAQGLAEERGTAVYFLIQLEDGSAPPNPVVMTPNGQASALPSGPIPVPPAQAYSAAAPAQQPSHPGFPQAQAAPPQVQAPQGYPSGQFQQPQTSQGYPTGQFQPQPPQGHPNAGYQQMPPQSGQFPQQPQGHTTGQFQAPQGYQAGDNAGYQQQGYTGADPAGGRHSKQISGKVPPSRVGPKKPSEKGYRKALYDVSRGKVNLGQSAAEMEEEQLRLLIEQNPGKFGYHIVMINLKGGVGKTTSTMMAAGKLKAVLGQRTVLAVDANPQTGTLIERVAESRRKYVVDPETEEYRVADIRDLLRDPDLVTRVPTGNGNDYELVINEACAREDLSQYLHTSSGLFDVLAGPTDPASAHGLTADEYNKAMDLADRHYGLIVTDCGTDMTHPVTLAALRRADMVVFVTEPEQGSRVLAERAMTCLYNYPTDVDTRKPIADEFGVMYPFRPLVQRSMVLLNQRSGGKPAYTEGLIRAELHQVLEKYGATVRPPTGSEVMTAEDLLIHDLPHDKHLKEGGEIESKLLQPATHRATLRFVAGIAADFPHALRRNQERARVKAAEREAAAAAAEAEQAQARERAAADPQTQNAAAPKTEMTKDQPTKTAVSAAPAPALDDPITLQQVSA